eukprot:gene7284-11602_t
MVQTSQMNIPYDSATTFFTAPYNQQLADHGVTKDEYQNTLFRVSHKYQHSGSSTLTNCCNIFNFSMSFCCCVILAFVFGLVFLIVSGAPAASKSSIKTAFTSTKYHTYAYGGEPIKYSYLTTLATTEHVSFNGFNSLPTERQINTAFTKDVVYVDMDVLTNSKIKQYLCDKLKSNRNVKFFGGFRRNTKNISWLKKCRSERHVHIITYIQPMSFSGFIKMIFSFILVFVCVLTTPFCCCFAFKVCNKRSSSGISQILLEETAKYHQRGVQFVYNNLTKSIDVLFYNGPVPQFQPQVQVQQFVPQQQFQQQPQYREVQQPQQPQQKVQVQPQFNVQPTFTVQQQQQPRSQEQIVQQSNDTQNVYQNVYYSSNVDEVAEEPQTQAFLYPKQQGIINDDTFE